VKFACRSELSRFLLASRSRRSLLGLLASIPITGGLLDILSPAEASAAGRRKRRKKRHKHGKGRRRSHRRRQRKREAPVCTPDCSAKCAGDDGCGGTCPNTCTSTQIYEIQTCETCDVCLDGCAFDSISEAVTAANAGATVRICPGIYQLSNGETILINKPLTLAGAGADAAGTIIKGTLDAPGPIIQVNVAGSVELRDLVVTGATRETEAAGILVDYSTTTVTLTRVTVTDNHAGATAGGIRNDGVLYLNAGTEVTFNSAGSAGGGIVNAGSLTLRAGSKVANNTADSGAGILNLGSVTIEPGSELRDNQQDDCLNQGGVGCPS
jgi:hypothetical protein